MNQAYEFEKPNFSQWIILISASLSFFVVTCNTTALINALPVIQKQYSIAASHLQWLLNSYILAAASLIAVAGKLSDIFDKKKVFLFGLALYILGSLIVIGSFNFITLVIGRSVQGIAAAFITSITLTVLKVTFKGKYQHSAISVWTASIGLGTCIGPFVGGILTEYLSWQYIFWASAFLMFISAIMAAYMKKYDFDKFIHRRNTDSFKWDFGVYKQDDMLPMWVADMDFKSADEILEALNERIEHGVFGYTAQPAELEDLVVKRMKDLYNWEIKKEWLVWLPGLVTGFNVACRALGDKGDDIVTSVPAYYPFLAAPENNSQNLIKVQMVEKDNRWTMDFEAIEKAITPNTKMYILCNPHNPAGTMFTKEELTKLADICKRHNILICSDEIHCDLILTKEAKHIPLASISEEITNSTITLMAPSKTWNIAGLGCSFAIIPNEGVRGKYEKAANGLIPHVNLLGYTAALAAYKYGQQWLDEVLEYLRGNLKIIQEFVEKTTGLSMKQHDATYLAWIDANGLGIEKPAAYFEKFNVGISEGATFAGPGFVRINFGCSRAVLEEALKRMDKAIAKLKK